MFVQNLIVQNSQVGHECVSGPWSPTPAESGFLMVVMTVGVCRNGYIPE